MRGTRTPPKGLLTGWGVRVKLPPELRRRRRRGEDTSKDDGWQLLMVPGTETPLCTSLAGARAWLNDFQHRGCVAELVPLEQRRGPSRRPPVPRDPIDALYAKKQLTLF